MDGGGVRMREERRTITALFADVVGSTSVGERLDPEDVRDVVGGAVALAIEVIEEFGGTVKDIAGDGVLALFGAPTTREDDAERAIRAGLEIHLRMRPWAQQVANRFDVDPPAFRVGIETGLVVLGPVGGGTRVEYGATGDALNTAARLQAHAPAGGVLVGPITRQHAEDRFDWEEPVELELKGKEEPVLAALVAGERETSGARRVVAEELVGRTGDVARAIELLRGSPGGILILEGEAGIGKTRLLAELRARLEHAFRWLEGRCTAQGTTTPYWPFRDIVRSIEAALGPAGWGGLADAAPDLRGPLALLAGHDALKAGAPQLPPESQRFLFAEALGTALGEVAASAPIAVVIEDLHWIDASSMDAIERLQARGSAEPTRFVLTTRAEPGPAERFVDRLERGSATRLRLGPLGRDEARELLGAVLGGGLPPALEERILETAEGNPFFLSEIARSLVDTGALTRDGDRWHPTGPFVPEIPATVDRVLLARIDRLQPRSHTLLTAASVLGRTFTPGLLGAIVDAEPAAQAFEPLVTAGLLEREGTGYSFSHALIQEVAYATLLRRTRRELHRRAAHAMETAGPPSDEQAPALARHHAGAGDHAAALRWRLIAADRAEAVSALVEAINHLDEAHALAAELPDEAVDLAGLSTRRGRLRGRTGDLAGARQDLERALELARSAGDRHAEMVALDESGFLLAGASDYRAAVERLEAALRLAEALEDDDGRVSALSRLAIVWTNRLRFDHALEAGERALAIAETTGDLRHRAIALDALKQVALELGDFDALDRYVAVLGPIHEERGDRWHLQFVEFETGYAATARGAWDEADLRLARALAMNRELRDDGNEPLHLTILGWLRRAQGRLGEALGVGGRAFELARARGHEEWTAFSGNEFAATLMEVGAADDADDALRAATAAGERSGADLHLVRSLGTTITLSVRTGNRDRVLRLTDELEARLDGVTTPGDRAYAFGWDATVGFAEGLVERGEAPRAIEELRLLRSAVEASPFPEAVARAALGIAGALAALHETETAVGEARAALLVAERAGLPLVRRRAHRVLAELLWPIDVGAARRHLEEARAEVDALLAGSTDATLRLGLAEERRELDEGGRSTWPTG